jgi:hypothetical protein
MGCSMRVGFILLDKKVCIQVPLLSGVLPHAHRHTSCLWCQLYAPQHAAGGVSAHPCRPPLISQAQHLEPSTTARSATTPYTAPSPQLPAFCSGPGCSRLRCQQHQSAMASSCWLWSRMLPQSSGQRRVLM